MAENDETHRSQDACADCGVDASHHVDGRGGHPYVAKPRAVAIANDPVRERVAAWIAAQADSYVVEARREVLTLVREERARALEEAAEYLRHWPSEMATQAWLQSLAKKEREGA